jgi:hypothetical protein
MPVSKPIVDSICVEASCIGNPGDLEYRGVHTATREVIFHKRPMSNGTKELAEFLAIVHALAHQLTGMIPTAYLYQLIISGNPGPKSTCCPCTSSSKPSSTKYSVPIRNFT